MTNDILFCSGGEATGAVEEMAAESNEGLQEELKENGEAGENHNIEIQ